MLYYIDQKTLPREKQRLLKTSQKLSALFYDYDFFNLIGNFLGETGNFEQKYTHRLLFHLELYSNHWATLCQFVYISGGADSKKSGIE